MTNIDIQTLLGRKTLTLDPEILHYFNNRTVLITGAGGSIGSELVRTLSTVPCRVVAYDRSENNLTRSIGQSKDWTAKFIPELGDISDTNLLDRVFKIHRPYTVIHAAAYKHLPLLESCPLQAVNNNVFGTVNVLSTAVRHKCQSFVLISTDKAVAATSVMGATKRLAEMVTIDPFSTVGSVTRAIVVRMGNVLGSSGSVLPLFESQIKAGGPITITDPAATRFFMSPQESAALILTASAEGKSGDTFIPEMGEPVSIRVLAERLTKLMGWENIRIIYTGTRPGEKLTEQLYTGERVVTRWPRIWKVGSYDGHPPRLGAKLDLLRHCLSKCDVTGVMICLESMVADYQPSREKVSANA